MTGRSRALVALCAASVVVLASSWIVVVRLEWPGGMRSSYPARDGDPRLTEVARTATTVIDAIERHRSDAGVLPESIDEVGVAEPTGWTYVRTGADSYLLVRKLGWDTALLYERRADESSWIFSPGDGGRPDVRIMLEP